MATLWHGVMRAKKVPSGSYRKGLVIYLLEFAVRNKLLASYRQITGSLSVLYSRNRYGYLRFPRFERGRLGCCKFDIAWHLCSRQIDCSRLPQATLLRHSGGMRRMSRAYHVSREEGRSLSDGEERPYASMYLQQFGSVRGNVKSVARPPGSGANFRRLSSAHDDSIDGLWPSSPRTRGPTRSVLTLNVFPCIKKPLRFNGFPPARERRRKIRQ